MNYFNESVNGMRQVCDQVLTNTIQTVIFSSLLTYLEIATVANTAQAKKRAIQGESRRQRNVSHRSLVRTIIKKVILAIKSGNLDDAKAAFKTAVPVIDKMVNKKHFHENKAARLKSRLNARIKALIA